RVLFRSRCADDPAPWLAELERDRRAARVKLAGDPRWIAAEDAGRYRDALGCSPPAGLPAAFLEPAEDALTSLLLRWARRVGPFHTEAPAARFGLPAGAVLPLLEALEARGLLLRGAFRPGGVGREWVHREVLRTLRQRSLAKLRQEVAPVDERVLARFLCSWHEVGTPRRGLERLRDAIEQLEGLPLPFSALERDVLPARVPGFSPADLDALGNRGELVWAGVGARGPRDGNVALYLRERFSLLRRAPEPLANPTPLHDALRAALAARGASFLPELMHACGDPPREAFLAALWELVWAGEVSNDTFTPLRMLGGPQPGRSGRRHRHRPRVRERDLTLGGRWVLLDSVCFDAPSPTERAHALASSLLERYGVVSRAAVQAEGLPGGFAAVYGVLGALEERGLVRRGHFVARLPGAQFALPGAVERLRSERGPEGAPRAVQLAAIDPANPYGALVPWPEVPEGAPKPQRRLHCSVTLVEGAPVVFWKRGLKAAATFPAAQDPELLQAALTKIRGGLEPHQALQLEELDGAPAREAPLADAFARAGFLPSYRGLRATGRAP
ncbi:MAG: DEAD/DEAH box helicase, partial [Planctomycetes bacterium]|nr:DEAD/DEAH box helicase [Planctomycetota bacterium]